MKSMKSKKETLGKKMQRMDDMKMKRKERMMGNKTATVKLANSRKK